MSEWIVCRKDKIVNAENIGNTEYCFLYDRGNKFLNDKIVLNTEYYFIILDLSLIHIYALRGSLRGFINPVARIRS